MRRVVARPEDPTRPLTHSRKHSVCLEATCTMDSEVFQDALSDSRLEAEQHRKMEDYCYTEFYQISYQPPCAYW
jgi:hypothetical protein